MEKYYSKLGRKSLNPVLLYKMLLIGYLFNVDPERELEQEVHLNIAYRWFLGLDITDSVPDHSHLVKINVEGLRIAQFFKKYLITMLSFV